jgi:hypothetical protein
MWSCEDVSHVSSAISTEKLFYFDFSECAWQEYPSVLDQVSKCECVICCKLVPDCVGLECEVLSVSVSCLVPTQKELTLGLIFFASAPLTNCILRLI